MNRKLILILTALFSAFCCSPAPKPSVEVGDVQQTRNPTTPSATLTVNLDEISHVMAGGIGASWHAIRVEFKPETNARYQYKVRETCPQGSAVGANPPLDSTAWKDIDRLGKWLGLDWVRVEIDRRMYEPQKGQFTWDSEEMRTLYRILDWCQANRADVFLTEMWRDVDWLAYPGVHPLLSAPNSLEDFAGGLAALVDHLVRHKNYTCIKWLCIANEPPGGTWGYWWSRGADDAPFAPAFKSVRQALDQRGINLPLSGPDWTDLSTLDVSKLDFAPYVGGFDLHSYAAPNADFSRIVRDSAESAHQHGKPFFLTEMGDMSLGWGNTNPGPRSFEAVLSVAEKVLRGLNVGVDGFNRWSFLNRGDQDGQWQLVRTWNMETKAYLGHAKPEPVPFFGYAMLTRFTAKHSEVLSSALQFQDLQSRLPRVFTATLRSPNGYLTLTLANREETPVEVRFQLKGLAEKRTFYHYQITEKKLTQPGFQLASEGRQTVSARQPGFAQTVPPLSLTVFTTYNLGPNAPGITAENNRRSP